MFHFTSLAGTLETPCNLGFSLLLKKKKKEGLHTVTSHILLPTTPRDLQFLSYTSLLFFHLLKSPMFSSVSLLSKKVTGIAPSNFPDHKNIVTLNSSDSLDNSPLSELQKMLSIGNYIMFCLWKANIFLLVISENTQMSFKFSALHFRTRRF